MPGDVYIQEWSTGRDLAIDVVVANTRTADGQETPNVRRRTVGKAARDAERNKMCGTVNDGSGQLLETHLRQKGVTFQAMAFETTGASTSSWSTILKQLSESAHERRGHDAETFRNHWRVEMAMTIAVRMAEAVLRRAWHLAGRRGAAQRGNDGDDVLGPMDVELPMLVGNDGGGDGGISLAEQRAGGGG